MRRNIVLDSMQIEKNATPIGMRNFICLLVGILATLVCGITTVKEGLELLFLLPVAFTICSFLFSRAFSYWRENVAFVIIFLTIIVRYIGTPVLMTLSQTALTTINPSPGYYRLAIFIQIFELFATLAIIDHVWTKHKRKLSLTEKSNPQKKIDFKLTWLGAIFLVSLILLLIVRGHLSDLINRYSTWWHISEDFSAIYFYDFISVEIVKSVVGIILISFFSRCFHKISAKFDRFVYFSLATIVGACMTMFYMYDQRTALVQLIISSMVILLTFFPGQKKLTFIVFGIGGTILVAYVFSTGSMQYELGGSDEGILKDLSKMAELYVSGPSMIAITQQKYDWVRENMSAMTYVSDFITTSHMFGMFPFFRGINNMVADIPTSNNLFVESLGGLTYILPNYSLWTYYVSDIFGWLFEVVSIYFVIRVVSYVDKKKQTVGDACYYYALAYVEILLGQAIFVNNSFLLWHAFTNIPFWLLMFAFVNNLGKKIKFNCW